VKRERELTQESFDRLLAWLDPDREQAGQKYEWIRLKLIKIFRCRGCTTAEELTDETINRVTRRLQEIADIYVGDPALYFYGVAHKVILENVKRRPDPLPPPPPVRHEEIELEYSCLEQCMERLTSDSRILIMQYYQEDKQAKIDQRKLLAERLGIALNALRIRAHRIRASLQQCVGECVKARQASQA
jgi:DNA-directed RNA polymerase specialized sigma24 family protein